MIVQVWKHFVSETDEKKWTKVDKGHSSQVEFVEKYEEIYYVLPLKNQNPYSYFQGKRSAESDPLVGTAFLTTVQVNKEKFTKIIFWFHFLGKPLLHKI